MSVDLKRLQKVAEAATHAMPVRYFVHPLEPKDVAWSPTTDGRDRCAPQSYADCFRAVDAEHIAANSPNVTLALIARIRELEKAIHVAAYRVDVATLVIEEAGICDEEEGEVEESREYVASLRGLVAKGVSL